MKKFILAIVSVAFLAGAGTFVNAKDTPRDDIKKSIEEMNTLVEKYNKASDKKKPGIEKEIKEKVAANYDKHLKQMEERAAELEKRVSEMKAKLDKMKTEEAKTKHVDEITKKIISGEKPMLFRPPFKDGEDFKGPGPKGMKGPWHKGRKGHFKGPKGDKGEKGCPCAKGDKSDKGKGCPFAKGEILPPPPPEQATK
ncbi:MAG: hypothetical protein J6S61_03940 [Elusimicrobiaceae bacterium]|nr:hypothetical protein [Elusimicrobiaceae bacterium]